MRYYFESFDRFTHSIGWNGEAQSLSRDSLWGECHFGRTDTNQPARDVDYWTTGVSGVNRRIGLHEILVFDVAYTDFSFQSAQYASADRAAVTNRIAHHDNGLAEKIGRDIIQINKRESAFTFDFDEREILLGIAGDVTRVVNFAITGGNLDAQVGCSLHDVLIGYDVTGWINNEARAETLQALSDFAWLAAVGPEEFSGEIFKRVTDLAPDHALGVNVNYRWHYFRHREHHRFGRRVGRGCGRQRHWCLSRCTVRRDQQYNCKGELVATSLCRGADTATERSGYNTCSLHFNCSTISSGIFSRNFG